MDEKEKILSVNDLIDVKILQDIQDSFSNMTGMAALTTDSNGVPVTVGSNFRDFCMKYTRQSAIGRPRCENCDKIGAQISHKSGKSVSYRCHAGLIDFAAPIIANGEMVGCFICGQILNKPPNIKNVRETAKELGIDPDKYADAIKKIPIVTQERIEKAANFLQVTASGLSEVAFKSYQLHKSNLEIEKISRLKSDFLANMSHEIRTPMNAVIGLTDLALREDMPQAVREYLFQIKAAGKNLLVVINDILDFSKIESGKMNIVDVQYRALSIIQDLISIVNSRLGDKDVEFTIDVSPNMPQMLYGDNTRIHQVALNLMTNAIKFTEHGEIHLKVECEQRDKNTVIMKAAVSDTGIGIKDKDKEKLFVSFQQLDSKRNRNIEGTGLGLPICKHLLDLMGGSISFESEYGKGSTFYIEIPQKLIGEMFEIPHFEKEKKVAVISDNQYVKAQLNRDLEKLGAKLTVLDPDCQSDDLAVDYLIVEKEFFDDSVQKFVKEHPEMLCLLLVTYDSIEPIDIPNVRVLSKPVYSFSLYNAMGIQDADNYHPPAESENFPFVAPDAKILIVDDSKVNLTIASGLLEPLQMTIDTSQSAVEAIEKIHNVKYDLIFMDHMMPGVDGVEATHIIRRLIPSYNDVPIIALTANAIGSAREMLLREGMDDFVAKPIDLKVVLTKLIKWLPQEKVIPITEEERSEADAAKKENDSDAPSIDIKELNVKHAISLLGSEKLFLSVLKEYYHNIDSKSKNILDHKTAKQWREYTIEVHSLKSTSKQIGADHLSHLAAELEKAGNDGDVDLIMEKTDDMIKEYLQLKDVLSNYFADTPNTKVRNAKSKDISRMLEEMQEALDNFDTLQIDEVIEEMSTFKYSGKNEELFENLKLAAANSDIDRCLSIVSDWKEALNG